MLTTTDVMKKLDAPYQTVVSWIKRGLFPGARRVDTPRGAYWEIPADAVEGFEAPRMGRPPKPKEEKKGKRKG